MDEITAFLPPEVCGLLYHAARHLSLSGRRGCYRDRARSRRHAEKAQRLFARAREILGDAGLTSLLSQCMVVDRRRTAPGTQGDGP